MESLFLLIPLSVLLVCLIGGFLWWFVHSGQFDDLEGPAHRILMDDDLPAVVRDKAADKNKLYYHHKYKNSSF